MVVNHWFQQIEKVLEAMDITSDVAKIRLATFQLEVSPKYGGTGLRPLGT